MTSTRSRRLRVLHAGLLTAAALSLCAVVVARQAPAPRADAVRATLVAQAEKTVFAERCAECHRSEAGVWATTKHKKGFDELHTRESAKKIYAAMGLTVIKRGTEESTPACLQCHYSPTLRDGQLRAAEGVTCESCHGPARDWISVHNNYGVQGVDFQQAAKRETPEHRTQRIAQARAAGMRRPSDYYEVAANCFACHTVPNEELVNRGGHTTGSRALEFLTASQGAQRHNFLESFKTGDGKTNAERAPERKRLLFAVGRMVDLEYSLRAAAQATSEGRFFGAIAERVNNAADNVVDMLKVAPIAELNAALNVHKAVDVRINNRAALNSAADRIRDLTRKWLTNADGTKLAAIDPLWNDAAPAAPAGPVQSAAAPVAPAPVAVAPPAARGADPAPVVAPPVAPPAPGAPPAPVAAPPTPGRPSEPVRTAAGGARTFPVNTKPAWRSAPSGAYLPDVPCGTCHEHASQETWWRKDRHSQSVKALRAGDPKYVAIATAYGIASAEMASGRQICVWCHGTATSPGANVEVRKPVGCQQCHGPGAAYKEPHQKGYSVGVAAGLTDLKNAKVRAETCAGCHYVTDPGLIAAGHSSGAGFDIASSMVKIKHWGDQFAGKATDIAPGTLVAAHKQVIGQRGPVPDVGGRRAAPTVTAPVAPAAAAPAGAVVTTPPAPAAAPAINTPMPAPGSTGGAPVMPSVMAPPAAGGPVTVPPAGDVPAPVAASPAPGASGPAPSVIRSPEEQLLELKKRLEALYRLRVGRGGGAP